MAVLILTAAYLHTCGQHWSDFTKAYDKKCLNLPIHYRYWLVVADVLEARTHATKFIAVYHARSIIWQITTSKQGTQPNCFGHRILLLVSFLTHAVNYTNMLTVRPMLTFYWVVVVFNLKYFNSLVRKLVTDYKQLTDILLERLFSVFLVRADPTVYILQWPTLCQLHQ